MPEIPVKGTPEYEDDGYISFFARETRFNIDVRRVTPGAITLSAFAEGDFFTSGNQFRLRHAYITFGDFLIGQTWTTLSFLESLPFMIDFAAGDALFGGRAPQIRYTKTLSDQWKVAVAVESLDLLGIDNPNTFGLNTRAYNFKLFVNDAHWADGMSTENIQVKEKSKQTVTIPFSLNLFEMGRTVYNLVSGNRSMQYRFVGDMNLGTTIPMVGDIAIPFDRTGSVSISR